jgi:hypothetical protein
MGFKLVSLPTATHCTATPCTLTVFNKNHRAKLSAEVRELSLQERLTHLALSSIPFLSKEPTPLLYAGKLTNQWRYTLILLARSAITVSKAFAKTLCTVTVTVTAAYTYHDRSTQ